MLVLDTNYDLGEGWSCRFTMSNTGEHLIVNRPSKNSSIILGPESLKKLREILAKNS